jgi:hypothetical protein
MENCFNLRSGGQLGKSGVSPDGKVGEGIRGYLGL